MQHFRYIVPLALILALLAGCGDSSTQFVTFGVPRGTWGYERLDSQLGIQSRHVSILTLSDTLGRFRDTSFVLDGGAWRMERASELTLRFLNSIGDGYLRAQEVRTSTVSDPDTTMRYWYFFRRSDSVYFYAGMRFLGAGDGLIGDWHTDGRDSVPLGLSLELTFHSDSVRIIQRSLRYGSTDNVRRYRTRGDTLGIDGATLYGDRYEIVPGSALYITTHAGDGYGSRR